MGYRLPGSELRNSDDSAPGKPCSVRDKAGEENMEAAVTPGATVDFRETPPSLADVRMTGIRMRPVAFYTSPDSHSALD